MMRDHIYNIMPLSGSVMTHCYSENPLTQNGNMEYPKSLWVLGLQTEQT